MAEVQLRQRLLNGGPGTETDSQLTEASSGTSTPSSASTRSSMLATATIPSTQAPINLTSLFLLLLLLRVANAALTRTFFQPDEYWQSLEVAHAAVWGWGYRTWEWRLNSDTVTSASSWSDGPVRSFAHPALFVPIYWLLKVLRLDGTFLLTLAPRLLQAVFAAGGDLYTFRLALRILGHRGAWAALLSSIFSVYTLHTSTRTFSNSLEAPLTIAALYYWPLSLPETEGLLPEERGPIDWSHFLLSLSLAAAAIVIRPTSGIIWLFLGVNLVVRLVRTMKNAASSLEVIFTLITIAPRVLLVALSSLSLMVLIDSLYYGQVVLTPIAFVSRNIIDQVSLFYGASPWHFYFSSALPLLGFTTLPFMLQGWWTAYRSYRYAGLDRDTRRWYGARGETDPHAVQTLAYATLWTVLAYSLLGHKEFRFIQPLLPVLHIFAGYSLALLGGDDRSARSLAAGERELRKAHEAQGTSGNVELTTGVRHIVAHLQRSWHSLTRRQWAKLALLAHLPPAAYLVFWHCRAQVEVTSRVAQLSDTGELKSVAFLMPCHSTPWQSHLHREALETKQGSGEGGKAWFITCEPPASGVNASTYKDQSDIFYDDVARYLTTRFPEQVDASFPPSPFEASNAAQTATQHTWPSHLVVFEELLQRPGGRYATISDLLHSKGYSEQERLWNSLFHDDARRAGHIVILRWLNEQPTSSKKRSGWW